TWEGEAYEPLVDHYAVYGSESAGFPIDPQTLLAKTVYSTFVHNGMGGRSRTWHYRVVVVDAAGDRSRPSPEFSGSSTESVTVPGRPLATVGSFDHKSLELALAPAGSAQFPARFPGGVDVTAGPGAEAGWSYIHPGPMDSWAGRRSHRFTFRFRLEAVPAGAPWLAMWLIDTHASSPGAAVFALNGTQVREVPLERGATRGSLEGDATLPGTVLKPSYVEFALPTAALVAGENVLTIDKNTGSWHVYDAIGVFER
ncbi:polysaccharide lyase family protein, partial [Actinomadura sp. HBU206391]|uniref:polysaccharide lyase family protein n=1 Tax=Actinomadura sp. HBU206391 TaxID=2731692 RepID=UPI00164F07AF